MSKKFKLREQIETFLSEHKNCWFLRQEIMDALGEDACGKSKMTNVRNNLRVLHTLGVVSIHSTPISAGGRANLYKYCDVQIVPKPAPKPAPKPLDNVAPPPYRPHPSERYVPSWTVQRQVQWTLHAAPV